MNFCTAKVVFRKSRDADDLCKSPVMATRVVGQGIIIDAQRWMLTRKISFELTKIKCLKCLEEANKSNKIFFLAHKHTNQKKFRILFIVLVKNNSCLVFFQSSSILRQNCMMWEYHVWFIKKGVGTNPSVFWTKLFSKEKTQGLSFIFPIIIGMWGSRQRNILATYQFFLYTFVFMPLAIFIYFLPNMNH